MVLVVRQNYSSRRFLTEAVRQLRFADAKLLGFVMTGTNAPDEGRRRYYEKYGYSYGYGEESRKKRDKAS